MMKPETKAAYRQAKADFQRDEAYRQLVHTIFINPLGKVGIGAAPLPEHLVVKRIEPKIEIDSYTVPYWLQRRWKRQAESSHSPIDNISPIH